MTLDKNRPHPGAGDVLLKTLPHTGALGEDAGYDVSTTVVLPSVLAAGTYYLMPWTDPYDVVLEDTLAHLVNQDDPNQIDNNNYRARAIDILGAKPDLVVTAVETADAILAGGVLFRPVDRDQSEQQSGPDDGLGRPRVYLQSSGPLRCGGHRDAGGRGAA